MVAFCDVMDKREIFEERYSRAVQAEIRPLAHIRLGCNFCLHFEDDGKGQCVSLKAHYAPVSLHRR